MHRAKHGRVSLHAGGPVLEREGEALHLLLTTAVLFAPCLALAAAARRDACETFAPVCCGYILLLYVFGLFGVLAAGVAACIAVAAACGIWLLWRFVRAWAAGRRLPPSCPEGCGALLRRLATPWLGALALLYLWAFLAQRGRMYGAADEFSHWGLVVKNMCVLDAFGTAAQSTVIFRGYPPGAALFEYLLCKLGGGYEEGYALRGMALLQFGFLLPLARAAFEATGKARADAGALPGTAKKQGPCAKALRLAAALATVLLVPLVFFGGAYTELYVDALLGVLFAFLVSVWFFAERRGMFEMGCLLAGGAVLGIVKASGVSLAALVCAVCLADALWGNACAKRGARKEGAPAPRRAWRAWAPALLPLAGALLSSGAWKLHLAATGTSAAWDTGGVRLAAVGELFSGSAPAYRYAVCAGFAQALSRRSIVQGVSAGSVAVCMLVLAAAAVAAVRLAQPNARRRLRILFGGLFAGGVVYAAALLVLYLFTYTVYEAMLLASFERYLGTYVLGMALVTAVALLRGLFACRRRAVCAAGVAALLLGCALCVPRGLLGRLTYGCVRDAAATAACRETYAPAARVHFLTTDAEKDRVYVVVQNSVGLEYNILRYMLTPVHTMKSGDGFSLGAPYGEGDVWTQDLSAAEWQQRLCEDYTDVYLYRIDDAFKERYGALFEETDHLRDHTCWQVIPQGEGACTLRFVDLNGLEQAALAAAS